MGGQVFPQNQTLLDILGIVAGLSLMAEIFVLVTYFKHKANFKGTHMRLVVCLILADMVESLSNFGFFFTDTNQGEETVPCIANGALRLFGLVCSVMWVSIISHYSVYLVSRDMEEPSFCKYCAIALIIPTISCFVPLYGDISGDYPGYKFDLVGCLGDPETMLMVLYPPVIIALLYIIYNYSRIKKLKESEQSGKQISSLFKYPAILLCCWLPGLITRIMMVIYGQDTPFFMEVLLIVGLHSMGFTNGVFYGYAYRSILRKKKVEYDMKDDDEDQEKYELRTSLETPSLY